MAAVAQLPGEDEFDIWLGSKLRELQTDESVFGSYIKGILNGDETNEEKVEALEGIISEITENNISAHCQEILDQWKKSNSLKAQAKPKELDVEEKLVKLLESQSLPTVQQKEYTPEEKRIRDTILAQYSQIQVQEEDGFDAVDTEVNTGLERNTNVESIQQAERERREQSKLDSQRKKEKDKEDRERQKQQQIEKKEKRKTQKGERRR